MSSNKGNLKVLIEYFINAREFFSMQKYLETISKHAKLFKIHKYLKLTNLPHVNFSCCCNFN